MIRLFLAVLAAAFVLQSLAASRVAAQPAAVSTALLTLEDLPGEWTEEPAAEEDDGDTSFLCGVGSPSNLSGATDAGRASFTQGWMGPQLYQVVSRTPDAAAVIEGIRNLSVPCEWTETDDEGDHTTWTMDVLPFPSFGDETLAFRLSTALDDIAFLETDIVIIRRGDVVSVLLIISIGVLSPPEPQTALLESLAAQVDKRLVAVAE